MELIEILQAIEKDLILKNELTESLFKVNMQLAEKKFEHRKKYAEYLFKFKNEKSYKEIAQSKLSKEIFDIEVLEEKKMYLYNNPRGNYKWNKAWKCKSIYNCS